MQHSCAQSVAVWVSWNKGAMALLHTSPPQTYVQFLHNSPQPALLDPEAGIPSRHGGRLARLLCQLSLAPFAALSEAQ